MDGSIRRLLLAFVLASLSLPAADAAWARGPRDARALPPHGPWPAPVRLLFATPRVALATARGWWRPAGAGDARALDDPRTTSLRAEQGWSTLEFTLEDDGVGAFLEVNGRVGFELAAIRFDDGTVREIDLGGATRGRGLYELAGFDRSRRVATVTVRAIARSRSARVGVRLGR